MSYDPDAPIPPAYGQPPTPKKPKKTKKIVLWSVLGAVGLFVIVTIIGVIGLAMQPGGLEAATESIAAQESAEASAKAEQKAKDDQASAEAKAAQASSKAAEEAAAQASAKAACLPVDKAMLETIAEGASGVAITPLRGAAVKSKDLKNAYMIAMEFESSGGGPEVGVWTSGSLKPGESLLMAVDGFATSFTHWPDAGKSSFKISPEVHGVEEAKNCLK